MRALAHLVLMVGGFVASSFVAGTAILVAFCIFAGSVPKGQDAVFFIVLASFATAAFTFIPATIAAMAAEAYSIRTSRFFVLSGSVIGLLFGCLFLWPSERTASPELFLALSCAGPLAGWTYWRLAGRSSGQWREGSQNEFADMHEKRRSMH